MTYHPDNPERPFTEPKEGGPQHAAPSVEGGPQLPNHIDVVSEPPPPSQGANTQDPEPESDADSGKPTDALEEG